MSGGGEGRHGGALRHAQAGGAFFGRRAQHSAQHRLREGLHDGRQPEGLVERLHALNGRVQMTRADEAIGVRAHVLLEELREQGAALDEYGAEQRVQMQVADAVGHHQLRHRIGLGIASVGDGVLGQVIARGRHVLHANLRLVAP